MTTVERREHPRVVKRFEGGWRGSSGLQGLCFVTDLSLGGCFVESRATPPRGDSTVVSVRFGAHEVSLHGAVVYAESGMGFGVRFNGLTDTEHRQLYDIIGALTVSLIH